MMNLNHIVETDLGSPLNIVFLCGSLEPGKDGVGDYTRILAAQLIRHGARVSIIAINDRYVDGPQGQVGSSQTEVQESDVLELPVLRLASSLPWKQRIRLLQTSLDDLKPQWISLQYVPYAYSMKGIPFMLPFRLKCLKGNHRWHVMFHELWIGITLSSSIAHKTIGTLQRLLVNILLLSIQPRFVSTSNSLYMYLLSRIGVIAERLPLFSAIPVDSSQTSWMRSLLDEIGIANERRDMYIIAGMFGSCYPDYPLEVQARKLALRVKKQGKKLAFLAIGGGVGTGSVWEQRVRSALPDAIIKHLGRGEPAKVSAFLSCLDLGIPSSPVEYLGKSSAAAAMVLHGLNIDVTYKHNFPEYQHLNLYNLAPEELFESVDSVAQRLLYSFCLSNENRCYVE